MDVKGVEGEVKKMEIWVCTCWKGGVKDRIGVPDMYGNLKGAPQLAYVIAHAQMVSSGQFMPCARLFVLI